MPTLTPEQIIKGTAVRHARQPSQVGFLTGRTMPGVVFMAEVKWGIETKFEAVQILELFDTEEDDSFETLIEKKRYERIESLRSLMTFEKLSGSLSNVMYSMRTAEIKFFAHQFVPVLKFVNSPLSRLLIADEVGLGKTIEAGLIWTECQARFQARRLLVVCPPTLVPKWIRELRERFSIEAEVAEASTLKDKLDQFAKKGPTQSFALVTHYQAIRPLRKERAMLKPWLAAHGSDVDFKGAEPTGKWGPRPTFYRSLLEWDGSHPFLDLAVFDEAHLMKNTATANHLVGDVLSSTAQAVLALSATPLTTKTRDLYALLKLVDPDMFRDETTFNELSARNVPAVGLSRELSKSTIDTKACLDLIEKIPDSAAKNHLKERLSAIKPNEAVAEEERIELQGKANRLNELGAFLTRTRKVEVNEHKATRTPHTLDVHPTEEEMVFYNSVLKLIRQRVAEKGDALTLFHLIAPALTMTSCLPVMAEKLRRGESRWGDMEDLATLDTAYTEEEDDSEFVGEDQTAILGDRTWLPSYDFEANDSKYAKLRNELLHRSPDEKVIIFAFFKDTLRYLKRRLEQDGISCLYVSGDIKDRDERDQMLQQFESPEFRILLCSEVLAEGVDLQFCRVMVNYDLPWNPMRVEQRIGRIDRIGQEADTIVIINFHVHGTIDGSIYQHLYSKIGIFEENIGDLEGIMGSHVGRLTKDLLANALTAEQAAEKIRLTAEAIERERAFTAEIDEESDTLLGLRSYLQSSVRQGRSLGRYIKPSELRLFTEEFFADTYQGNASCILNWDTPAKDCLTMSFSFAAFQDFETFLSKESHSLPRGFGRDTRTAVITFDPEIHEEQKRKHRKLILANHIHPFVGWMTSSFQLRSKEWHPASGVKVPSKSAQTGIYLFAIMRISLKHPALSKEELLFRSVNVESLKPVSLTDSEALINDVLEHGVSWTPPQGYPDAEDALADALDALNQDCREIHEAFVEELELRINTKRSQVESHFHRQIQTQHRRLNTMATSSRARPQDITAARTRIRNLEVRLQEELENLDASEEVAPEFKRVACGLIKVSEP